MEAIDAKNVRSWGTFETLKIPSTIAMRCPHCGDSGVFSLAKEMADKRRQTVSATAGCPSCSHKVDIWAVNRQGECVGIYSYPANDQTHAHIDTFHFPSPALVRAYRSTVDSYNSKNYVATAVGCRRTLEGVFKAVLAEGKKGLSLAKAIEAAAEDVDFARPIRDLADVVRKGGNLGAHFDDDQEPSQELALAMVRLLEALIEYLFVLPKSIAAAEKVLVDASSAATGDDS